ncbi:hypothetical protein BHE74_00012058 [Ensete ventricosum]|uniref:Uncharacterized protein n=1 Tax=Ensete ventricosum TaxID=4639 RepID=A0A427B014_ENSVE|nr:hypothetical protein B296_00010417 [Ensete ventricosum]RWW34526.1 hypothetical protein GW17_00000708 [Ensete ventricosum]RWW79643.1 hypothetical protein BHE74_00012058 [Ensete ventricosum]RZR98163.1 hypothetical protein BHM03_00027477 [Ensete ventricosum]
MAVFSPSLSLSPSFRLSSFSSSSSFASRLRAPSLMLGARRRTPPLSVVSCSSGLASDSPNYPRFALRWAVFYTCVITMSIAREVASVTRLGIEVAIVVGGGNIFRGASWAGCSGLDRSSADYIGY